MSDEYEAIFDAYGGEGAQRNRINAAMAAYEAEMMRQRPSVLFRPKLFQYNDGYCALYGENIQEGCAGFGDTPKEAMRDFDDKWRGRV